MVSVEVLQVALCVVIFASFVMGWCFDRCESERRSNHPVDRRVNFVNSGASAAEG